VNQQTRAWLSLMRQILSSEEKCVDRESVIKYAEKLDLTQIEGTYADVAGNTCFKSLLPLALKALEEGADLYEVSSFLDWRDFEELVSEYLKLSGYESARNIRTKLKRYEYDVVAVDPVSRVGLVIDCKHWSPGYGKKGKLKYVANEHKQKCLYLAKQCQQVKNEFKVISKAKWFVPVIITLTEVLKGSLEGVLVVPIRSFRDFLINIEFYLDLISKGEHSLKIINECYVS